MIPAIRSRCLGIRVSAPSREEIVNVLTNVAKKEGCNLQSELAKRIADKSNRNLRYERDIIIISIIQYDLWFFPLFYHKVYF